MVVRHIFRATLVAVGLSLGTLPLTAQTYPDRVVKIVVPFTTGSPVDVLGRLIGAHLSSRLGQPVIIENRAGAGTSIGSKAVVQADADGYTLLIGGSTFANIAALYPNAGFDATRDLAPVAGLASWSHLMIIAPSVPAKTVPEFVAYAKANPGKLNFGYGLGTTPQVLGEMFKLATRTEINSIPYRGGAQAVADMLGDRIHLNFGTVATLLPLVRDGKVRAIATTRAERFADLPDVPTMTESGFPQLTFNPDSWLAVFAPARTPTAIVSRLNADFTAILALPEIKAAYDKLGFDLKPMAPAQLAAFLSAEMIRWPPIIKAAGLQPE